MKLVRNAELIETINRLNKRIAELEHMVGQLSRPVIEHVNIERVYLQNPTLERLEFGLESLDIKELSGALNLGNNFGVNVERVNEKQQDQGNIKKQNSNQNPTQNSTQNPTPPPPVFSSTNPKEQEGSSMERTSSGYRYKVNRTSSTMK